ncbi:SAM-dependent methyltransferase [Pseudoroseicyclus aestuarii]|uniref:Cyclopropane-fatty-acyl-phospholipid synthase n=1 Tax=Pseudoroseicyclus aestuarii TaxID=1795041 RepID=A0A318SYQ9_9RHOB|nr:cyclopropane-fatty-acyl-phospholipid synthase family protein [Pseudoroseicyclus aestuarii]PYE84917.1 cyclopropane-fatty-acyl-phospholipid synthase [Pseudoroseicyclus aestuarii]
MWSEAINQMLRQWMRKGALTLHLPDGTARSYGDGTAPQVTLRIHDDATLRRLALNPDLALGEAYMEGSLTVDGDDLHGLLELVLRNFGGGRRSWWNLPGRWLRKARRGLDQRNIAASSRRNVAHHYDLPPRLYDLFLDEDRQYSCAYFRDPGDGLEQAQLQKKHHIARKLRLEPGLRVLDIGCGWGGMALTLARDYGVQVTGVTLSEEQLKVAQRRAREEGLEDRVEFRLQDYRAVTETFDRIVSVGMFEHVGLPQFDPYFRAVHDLLAEDGVALVHTIGWAGPPGSTNPWIAKYIFPGGYIPSLSEVAPVIENNGLWLTDLECLRLHYALTLRHWYDRFTARLDEAREINDETFVRMWKFYLVASEQSFRFNRQDVFQFQISKRLDAVPITRDYLYRSGLVPRQAEVETLDRARDHAAE